MDIPVELNRVLITELSEQQVIFLREKGGDRSFPIMIGINEALAIDRRLKGIDTPRPMTHQLLENVIGQLHAQVNRIVINDLHDHTFIATLYLDTPDGPVAVDSRPSDAIALGVGLDTPIYVADKVFELVLKPSSSKSERLELLRQRMLLLSQRIAEFDRRLSDESFLAHVPPEIVSEHRRQLHEMKTEYDAIERVIKKLG